MSKRIQVLTLLVTFLGVCVAPFLSTRALDRETVYYIEENGEYIPDHCGGPPRDCYTVHPPD